MTGRRGMTAEEVRAVKGKAGFPDDRHGKRSSMRLLSLPALAAAFAPKATRKFAAAKFQ